MVIRTLTAASCGLDVYPVEVEVDGKQGVPQFLIIGLASRAVEEAKERITSALQNCDIRIRSKRTVVNLAPASVPKTGTTFDLAIAVGLLKMYGELQLQTESIAFFGELGLDGQVKPITGALPLVLGAKKLGFQQVVLPEKNAAEVSTLSGVTIFTLRHLNQLLAVADKKSLSLPQIKPQPFIHLTPTVEASIFTSLIGQPKAKRAAIIAAAGGHHLLLIGPPGTGKTQLSKAISELLPPLSETESIEVTAVHSLAGLTANGLITTRPFRAPHHSISRTALIGGGTPLKPGELSLAHQGVLFLDELLEFPSYLLDMLRQPLEDRQIALSFSTAKTTFPANITVVAATNLCPCGYFGSRQKPCSCSPAVIDRYKQKLSGPLNDRFGLTVYMETEQQLFSDWNQAKTEKNSLPRIQEKIALCRATQQHRYKDFQLSSVSQLTTTQCRNSIVLTSSAKQFLARESITRQLTGRRYWSVIKVAQTIADLEKKSYVSDEQIQEALSFQKE